MMLLIASSIMSCTALSESLTTGQTTLPNLCPTCVPHIDSHSHHITSHTHQTSDNFNSTYDECTLHSTFDPYNFTSATLIPASSHDPSIVTTSFEIFFRLRPANFSLPVVAQPFPRDIVSGFITDALPNPFEEKSQLSKYSLYHNSMDKLLLA